MADNVEMWCYWRDKRGSARDALESDFPDLAQNDDVLRTALAMIKTGEAAIEQRMRELETE